MREYNGYQKGIDKLISFDENVFKVEEAEDEILSYGSHMLPSDSMLGELSALYKENDSLKNQVESLSDENVKLIQKINMLQKRSLFSILKDYFSGTNS